MTEQEVLTEFVKLMTKFKEECHAPHANPYLLIAKLEKDLEWLRHEMKVEGQRP